MSFDSIARFEEQIASYFGSPYAVAVDCCTHALELCVRYKNLDKIVVPKHTYISVPFLAYKLGLELQFKDVEWQDYYYLEGSNIVDAAVLWKENSYIPETFMCLSFQFRKHLSLGRGGMILLDNKEAYTKLKKMVYDGREPDTPWREQDISMMGYHYYMTPETAQLGIDKLSEATKTKPKKWTIDDWPDLSKMTVFKNLQNKGS